MLLCTRSNSKLFFIVNMSESKIQKTCQVKRSFVNFGFVEKLQKKNKICAYFNSFSVFTWYAFNVINIPLKYSSLHNIKFKILFV